MLQGVHEYMASNEAMGPQYDQGYLSMEQEVGEGYAPYGSEDRRRSPMPGTFEP